MAIDTSLYRFDIMAKAMVSLRPDLWSDVDEVTRMVAGWAEELSDFDEVATTGTGGFELEYDPFADSFGLKLNLVEVYDDGDVFDWTTNTVNVDLAL